MITGKQFCGGELDIERHQNINDISGGMIFQEILHTFLTFKKGVLKNFRDSFEKGLLEMSYLM